MNQSTLLAELQALEGIISQNPETGASTSESFVNKYTNRIFGAPFQLLDSVDKRFPGVNSHVGNEYLRNILLNSPILRIRPGLPKYTGGDSANDIVTALKNIYFSASNNDLNNVQNLILSLSKATIFSAGSKLQRRMYGFREQYYDYMQHVNYMCRSCAVFMNLTDTDRFPTGAFYSDDSYVAFNKFKWENYRFVYGSLYTTPHEYLMQLLGDSFNSIMNAATSALGAYVNTVEGLANWLNASLSGSISDEFASSSSIFSNIDYANENVESNINALENKISAVEFMVEPVTFEETLVNNTKTSLIESTVDSLRESVGSELAWITGSSSDVGIVGEALNWLGTTAEDAVTSLAGAVEGVTGGFVGNVLTGALQGLKGQKMIYPEIYESSNSNMDYNFSVTLTTPYGDAYNYYMNILVPLMHLIALAAPRMVTANTVSSPYLVQAYIPGQCTCQLGIVQQMTIQKNPNGNKVSVNGFPLEVKVNFQIKELYNAMSISPGNDPTSFLFNETLNDYMANLAGLIPSADTYTKQRANAFYALEDYIVSGGLIDDVANVLAEKYEDFVNPFVNR